MYQEIYQSLSAFLSKVHSQGPNVLYWYFDFISGSIQYSQFTYEAIKDNQETKCHFWTNGRDGREIDMKYKIFLILSMVGWMVLDSCVSHGQLYVRCLWLMKKDYILAKDGRTRNICL